MTSTDLLAEAASHLLRRDDLARSGLGDRKITAMERSGELVRVRAGIFIPRAYWETAFPEARHALAIHTAHLAARQPPVFSHRSAAVLHGMPAWSSWLSSTAQDPLQVHTTVARGSDATSTRITRRHIARLSTDDVTQIGEFAATNADLTLADLARSDSFAVALACADAYLHRSMGATRRPSTRGLAGWQDRFEQRSASMTGYWGVRAVRALAELADPRAESPLESFSRLRLLQLGFIPELQVPVPARSGGHLYLDFVLPDLGFWGECDGKSKYTSSELLRGSSAKEIVYEEKRRQEWVEGTTGLRCIRWGVSEVRTLERFAAHLRAHRVPVPGRPSEAHPPATAKFLATLP